MAGAGHYLDPVDPITDIRATINRLAVAGAKLMLDPIERAPLRKWAPIGLTSLLPKRNSWRKRSTTSTFR
jgi:hypothetical protein